MGRTGLWLLLAAALALRLAWVADVRQSVTFHSPLVDAYTYDQAARQIAEAGPGALELPYYQPPLYPMLLGLLYSLTGGSTLAPRIVQAVLGALTVVLVAGLAAGLGGRRAGWIAGGLAAVYGPALWLEAQLLPPAWLLATTTAAVWLLLRADEAERNRAPALAGAGLLLGLAAAARPTGLLLAVAATAWWVGGRGPDLSRRLRGAALLAGLVLVPILPFTVANRVGGGESLLVSYNGGINFYLGNGARSDSLTAIQPGHHWDKLQIEPFRAGVRSRAAESRYWLARGLREATADPGAWLGALGRKTVRLLDVRETPRNTDYEVARRESALLRWLPGFGLVAPLAALGLLIGFGAAPERATRRARWLLLLVLGSVTVQNLLFFVAGRYRLEAVPTLCVLAGLGTDALLRRLARRPRARDLVPAVAVLGLTAAVVWIDFLGERGIDETRAAINRGVALRRAGFDASAARAFRDALRQDPDDVDAHRLLAESLIADGNLAGALVHLDAALAGAPDYVQVLLTKGRCLERLDRGDEAGPLFAAAVEADPYSKDARLGLGVWLAVRARYDEARAQFEAGLRIDPADPDLRHNLGNLERVRRGS